MDDLIPLVAAVNGASTDRPVDAVQSARDDASLAAFELKAMLDVLNGAAASNVTPFDQTLEACAATMMDEVQAVCDRFGQGGETGVA